MGARGPTRKSNEQRKLEGDPGRLGMRNEVKSKPLRPDKPGWLSPEASKEWDYILPIIEDMGILGQADGHALAMYCTSYARWKEAERTLQQEGHTVATGSGSLKPHPAWRIAQESFKQMTALLKEFGLTPAARARLVGPGEGGKEDDDADFFGY